jgi:hypothetical protein
MSSTSVDRQIVSGLDQLHREMAGTGQCRWEYDGAKDEYSCPHLRLGGRVVIGRVEGFNRYTITYDA